MSQLSPDQMGGAGPAPPKPIPTSPGSGLPSGKTNPTPPAPQIPGITPSTLGPVDPPWAVQGSQALDNDLHSRGLALGTQAADEYLLGLPGSSTDQPYNFYLDLQKANARKRMDLRAQFPNRTPDQELDIQHGFSPRPSAPQVTPDPQQLAQKQAAKTVGDIANKRAANEDATRGKPTQGPPGPGGFPANQPVIVDANGNLKSGQSGPPSAPSSQSGALAGGNPGGGQPPVLNGSYVWLGNGLSNQSATFAKDANGNYIKDKDGQYVKVNPQGNTVGATDVYMSTDDAKTALFTMSPDQVMAIQQAYHLKPTGVVDQKTMTLWNEAVDISSGYTKAGRHMSPSEVLAIHAKAGGSGGGGGGGHGHGGGGGRGGGAAKFKLSDVQSLLTSVAQKEVGRDPTQAEVNAFYGYFNGLAGGDTANPSQIATDWVRTHLGSETGSYQAATNYYQAMLSVLGGSAIGGAA